MMMTKHIGRRLHAPLLGLALVIAPCAIPDLQAVAGGDDDSSSLLGSYLAGRFARVEQDANSAADFYAKALARDPGNEIILEQTFLLEATNADWGRAAELAQKIIALEPSHRIARFVLGCKTFKDGKFQESEQHFAAARKGPIADLTGSLARAWVRQGEGKTDEAMAALDSLTDADWARFYQRYHRGLLADLAGRQSVAKSALSEAFKKNPSTLRIAEAYARHAASNGDRKLARSILKNHIDKSIGHPLSTALMTDVDSGKPPAKLVTTAQEGLAEVFYGVGDALTGEGGVEMGVIFLQLALYLRPDLPLAHLALAEAYESSRNFDSAISSYDRIDMTSPVWVNVQIRKAMALNALERVDDATKALEKLVAERPKDTRPLDALGNILRSRERYKEAAEIYGKAIALTPKPEKKDWALFYSRGVCFERTGDWARAEADLKKALELDNNQPLALNYLGYSWVDKHRNVKRAMDLIRKAVKLKPDDGYFVDSLGWAHYRLGDLKAAVEQLERAVELKPDDAVINDHLGDVYWQIGRHLEARYQWSQALSLKPEPDDATRIKQKLEVGLTPALVQPTKAAERTVSEPPKTR